MGIVLGLEFCLAGEGLKGGAVVFAGCLETCETGDWSAGFG